MSSLSLLITIAALLSGPAFTSAYYFDHLFDRNGSFASNPVANKVNSVAKLIKRTAETATTSKRAEKDLQSWYLTSFERQDLSAFKPLKDSYGASRRDYVSDPAGGGSRKRRVLRVFYPAGSYSVRGGTGFHASPLNLSKAKTVRLKYQVYFSRKFDFVKGGKLPGLYGGHKQCSGGRSAASCFSTRYMFRKGGAGELYVYLNKDIQRRDLSDSLPRPSIFNPKYGTSIGRGRWSFKPSCWYTLEQTITMNKPGDTDGSITVSVNGRRVLSVDRIAWRTHAFTILGIQFETFFGGHDSTWAPPRDQYTYFKDFSLVVLK